MKVKSFNHNNYALSHTDKLVQSDVISYQAHLAACESAILHKIFSFNIQSDTVASVVGKRREEAQTKESARRYVIYYVGLGHMFLLVGCGRGARPYVSIGWLWAWGSAICFYYVPLGHMFVLVGCGRGA